jgi:copper chaperone
MGIIAAERQAQMEKLSLMLDGMGCGGCVKNVRKVLDAMPGVRIENVAVGSASFEFDPEKASPQSVAEALAKAGYPVRREDAARVPGTSNGGRCGSPA